MMKKQQPKSFNDKMMLLVGVPVVLAWMSFACIVIWKGLNDENILNNIEGFTTLIAIIGGPALLILTSMLELWKNEQNQEITAIPDQISKEQSQDSADGDHRRLIESLQAEHARALEAQRQAVELGLLSALPTNGDDEE
jgi:hypothetical protein